MHLFQVFPAFWLQLKHARSERQVLTLVSNQTGGTEGLLITPELRLKKNAARLSSFLSAKSLFVIDKVCLDSYTRDRRISASLNIKTEDVYGAKTLKRRREAQVKTDFQQLYERNFNQMIYKKGHVSACVALLLLVAAVLACNFKNDLEQANKLVAEANDELKEIKKIQDNSEAKIKELKTALDGKNVSGVKSSLDDLIKMIDQGLKHGSTAAEKVETASKLNVDKPFKEYLDLKAQSFRKQIDAFEARKKSAEIFREAYGSNDSDKINKAKDDFNREKEKYESLLDEARELSDKADKIQRENPTIKSTS